MTAGRRRPSGRPGSAIHLERPSWKRSPCEKHASPQWAAGDAVPALATAPSRGFDEPCVFTFLQNEFTKMLRNQCICLSDRLSEGRFSHACFGGDSAEQSHRPGPEPQASRPLYRRKGRGRNARARSMRGFGKWQVKATAGPRPRFGRTKPRRAESSPATPRHSGATLSTKRQNETPPFSACEISALR